ncbi:basal-body rod modification protein FlgD [Geotalea uraniireducens]|uniref:Basal-body rod modification protein FlgD n=1 Tax=Geotalea uraniireducens TaxID=351604 RepID=A0ABN6VMV4_9BACT|nr:flagellar hook assembly protein FlgD [Geotalea uraniireducens]BDV41455.1 basal-body rod modification protein FlgD [Geotalea uraniireducens]
MITGITNTTTTTTSAADAMKQSTGLNSNDFLQLFITQLQNQDPLNPQDSSQFITQLAQLTQVEQSYNTNTNLQNLQTALNGSNSLSAVSFIGKQATVQSDEVGLTSGTAASLGYRLPADAAKVLIDIKDSAGNTVRTLTLGQTATGDGTVIWDGKDAAGNQLPSGTYTYSVAGINSNNEEFSGTALLTGTVSKVNLEGQEPVLTIGGIDVSLSNLLSVKG